MTVEEILNLVKERNIVTDKSSGIYVIYCKTNNCIYIGSAFDFIGRFRKHKSDLKRNKHLTRHLQYAWNKYGEENFEFHPVEKVKNRENLLDRENYYLTKVAKDSLFNTQIPAISRTTEGWKAKDSQVKSLSQRMMGNKYWLGRKLSPEHAEKLRQAVLKNGTAHLRTEEVKKKVQEKTRGKLEDPSHVKITQKLAVKIKEEFDKLKKDHPKKVPNGTHTKMAKKYKVSLWAIRHITSGAHWAFEGYDPKRRVAKDRTKLIVTLEMAIEIKKDYEENKEKIRFINEYMLNKYPYGKTTMYAITSGKHPIWKSSTNKLE